MEYTAFSLQEGKGRFFRSISGRERAKAELHMKWILASASPRRRELLAELIDEFEVIPSLADENLEGDFTPETL